MRKPKPKKLNGPFEGGHWTPNWVERVGRKKTWTDLWIGAGAKFADDWDVPVVRVPIMWGFFYIGTYNVMCSNGIEEAVDMVMKTPQYILRETLEEELDAYGFSAFMYGAD